MDHAHSNQHSYKHPNSYRLHASNIYIRVIYDRIAREKVHIRTSTSAIVVVVVVVVVRGGNEWELSAAHGDRVIW